MSLATLPAELLTVSLTIKANNDNRAEDPSLACYLHPTGSMLRALEHYTCSIAFVAASRRLLAMAKEAYFFETEFNYTISIRLDWTHTWSFTGIHSNFEPKGPYKIVRRGTFAEHDIFFKGTQRLLLHLQLDDADNLRALLRLATETIRLCEKLGHLTVDLTYLVDEQTAVGAREVLVERLQSMLSEKQRMTVTFIGNGNCSGRHELL